MRISWSRFVRRIAAVLLIGGSTVLSSAMCYAFNAFDSAADPVYLDGWQDGDNGGTGFTPWDFSSSLTYNGIYYGQYTMSTFHAIDNGLQGGTHYSNPFNNIGRAWDLGISPTSNGVPRAGRGFSPLQIGQTLEVVFDNPTTRQFFKGYTISLHGGTGGVDGNIGYQGYPCNPPAMPVKKMDLGTFEYFTNGAWGIGDSAGVSTGVLDTDTAAAGAVFTVERTGLETYDVKLHPLGGGPDFVAMGRTFANAVRGSRTGFNFRSTTRPPTPPRPPRPRPTSISNRSKSPAPPYPEM